MRRYVGRNRTPGGRLASGVIVMHVVNKKTQRTAPVRLYKTTMTFWATSGAESTAPYFESKDGNEVERWLYEQLGKSTEADRLDWQPVVSIDVADVESRGYGRHHSNTDEQREASVKVVFNRFYLALTHDKREWRVLPWEACDVDSPGYIEDNDRALQSRMFQKGPGHEDFKPGNRPSYYSDNDKPFVLPHYRKGETSYLRYTPQLWAGLIAIADQIDAAYKTIERMLTTKAGLALVAESAADKVPLQLVAKVVSHE